MSLYDELMPQLTKMLENLLRWLEEADAWAEERGFDRDLLASARLFPDQFELARQVQSACDTMKFAAARLSDTPAPRHPDDEVTLAQLNARVNATLDYLRGFGPADFEGADDRPLFLPMLQGGSMTGRVYVRQFVVPNAYFHLCMAYAILRQSGVRLGKRVYLGHVDVVPPPEG